MLIERERLGSTGIGTGIAVPHGQAPPLTGLANLSEFYGLETGLFRFEAVDERPVDTVFLLLAPGREPGRSSEGAGAGHRACCGTAGWARSCAAPRTQTHSTPF